MTWLTLLQTASDLGPLATLGVGGLIAAGVIAAWRQERKESQERYATLAKESQDRYAALAEDFRLIVQDNTKAITALAERLAERSEATDDALTVRMLLAALRAGKLINIETEGHQKTGGAGGNGD